MVSSSCGKMFVEQWFLMFSFFCGVSFMFLQSDLVSVVEVVCEVVF